MAEAIDDEVLDGRRLRRDRNREAVVAALLELYREGNLEPSSVEIAERAGLSARSLFRYFDDIDDLCRAAIQHQLAAVEPLIALDDVGQGSLVERVERLVAHHARLYEAVAPVARVSRRRAPSLPVVQRQLGRARSFLRSQLRQQFAPELRRLTDARAAAVLAAADVLTSFESWELLRHDQGLSRAKAATAVKTGLLALLDGGR